MTKRQTRLFFIVGTTVCAAIFVGLTIDSHLQLRRAHACGEHHARR